MQVLIHAVHLCVSQNSFLGKKLSCFTSCLNLSDLVVRAPIDTLAVQCSVLGVRYSVHVGLVQALANETEKLMKQKNY